MIDDLITVSECGIRTTMINSYINTKTAIKKLQFGTEKCKKIHIGKSKEEYKCQAVYVDKGSLHKKKTEIYWSFTNMGVPPPLGGLVISGFFLGHFSAIFLKL